MAVQVKQSVKYLPPLLRIDLKKFDDLEGAKAEMRKMKELINKSALKAYKALRSLQNAVDSTFDKDGHYKLKVGSQHIAAKGLTSDTLRHEVKGWMTSIAFEIVYNAGAPPASRNHLYWGKFPTGVGTANIIWHPHAKIEALVSASVTMGGTTHYAYLDVENKYPPFTIYPTGTMASAMGAGKILMCQAKASTASFGFRYAMWGATLWRGA